ncbi:MAG: peroxiredoxin [Pirellulales bacterium]
MRRVGVGLLFGRRSRDVSVGEPAPDFTLTGSDGKTYHLKDLAGKTVVVAWFPKAFTGGCTAECKSLKESGELLKAFDVVYFTASCDTVADNTKFAESLMLDYPILSDPTRDTAKAYGLVSDAKGNAKRVTFIIGPDGKVADVETKVNTKEHAKQVAEKLTALKTPLKK